MTEAAERASAIFMSAAREANLRFPTGFLDVQDSNAGVRLSHPIGDPRIRNVYEGMPDARFEGWCHLAMIKLITIWDDRRAGCRYVHPVHRRLLDLAGAWDGTREHPWARDCAMRTVGELLVVDEGKVEIEGLAGPSVFQFGTDADWRPWMRLHEDLPHTVRTTMVDRRLGDMIATGCPDADDVIVNACIPGVRGLRLVLAPDVVLTPHGEHLPGQPIPTTLARAANRMRKPRDEGLNLKAR